MIRKGRIRIGELLKVYFKEMNRTERIILVCLVCVAVFAGGCKSSEPSNQNQAVAANAQANPEQNSQDNSNRPIGPPGTIRPPVSHVPAAPVPGMPSPTPANPGDENNPPASLLGTYVIVEVRHKGIIDMISAANTTQITFTQDGKFRRESKKGGRVDHTDAGDFKVEGKNQLVLVIHESKQKIQDPPVVIRHPVQVSTDGSEMIMTSSSGSAATFRRLNPVPGR